MRLFQARRHSSTRNVVDPRSMSTSPREPWDQAGSRHDSQMFTGRTVPADPYAVWLEQREGRRGSSAVPV
jgi:hypothetical protein